MAEWREPPIDRKRSRPSDDPIVSNGAVDVCWKSPSDFAKTKHTVPAKKRSRTAQRYDEWFGKTPNPDEIGDDDGEGNTNASELDSKDPYLSFRDTANLFEQAPAVHLTSTPWRRAKHMGRPLAFLSGKQQEVLQSSHTYFHIEDYVRPGRPIREEQTKDWMEYINELPEITDQGKQMGTHLVHIMAESEFYVVIVVDTRDRYVSHYYLPLEQGSQ